MTANLPKVTWPLALAVLLSSGCAATSSSTTYSAPGQDEAAFANFLVIGGAGTYNSRAQFERTVVSGLKAEGATGRPYHVVAGGNKRPTRDDVLAAIEEHGFDAVIVTRALNTEADVELRSTVTGTKVSRKEGGLANLFRYDYDEIDEPLSLAVDMRVTFSTELYSAASRNLVWSSESTGPKVDNVGVLIDETAKAVVKQLKRAGKIAR